VYKNDQYLFSDSISLEQMIAVGDVTVGDKVEIRMRCNSGESGSMTIYSGILNDSIFRQGVDVLRSSKLELTQFTNTSLEGTIRCDRDGLLYTSVPDDGNWTVFVDGEAIEPVLVGNIMLGAQLTAGTHTIRMEYHNKAFQVGAVISLSCLVVFAVLAVGSCLLTHKHGKFTK
jgi:uncharacterized membrane protein YfhO